MSGGLFYFLLAAGVSLHVSLASGSSHAAIYGSVNTVDVLRMD